MYFEEEVIFSQLWNPNKSILYTVLLHLFISCSTYKNPSKHTESCNHLSNLSPFFVSPTRFSTAQGPSCLTSTHRRTPFTAPRASPSRPTVTWQWRTLGTTASRSTATCSRADVPTTPLRALTTTTTQPMYSTGRNDFSNAAV